MSNTIPHQSFVDKIAAGLKVTGQANHADVIKSNSDNKYNNGFKKNLVNDKLVNQKLFDKVAAGLRDIASATDTSKAEEVQETFLDLSSKAVLSKTVDTNKFGGVNEAIENPVKPVLWLEPDSSVSASAVWAAAKGTEIPVEEILNCRDGVTMTALQEYFEVKVKTAKEI